MVYIALFLKAINISLNYECMSNVILIVNCMKEISTYDEARISIAGEITNTV